MARRGLRLTRSMALSEALRELLVAAGELAATQEPASKAAEVLGEGRVFLEGRRLDGATELTQVVSAGHQIELGAKAENTGEEPRVLDERWGLLAVYKPSGVASEPDQRSRDSLVVRLAASLGQRLHAVSRLDAQVSGVMLVAREGAHQLAQELQARGAVERRYVGLAASAPEPLSGTWRGAIGLGERGKRRVGGRGAKPAVTHYRTLSTLPETAQALELRRGRERLPLRPCWLGFGLETGRTHQIRVHCAHAGLPLLGDGLYAGAAAATLPRGNVLEFKRIGLHALSVGVEHAGSTWRVACPPPQTLEEWWSAMGGEPPGFGEPLTLDYAGGSLKGR